MTINIIMAAVLAVLYSVGFYLIMQRSLMRVVLGLVILGHGTNLFLQVAGGPSGAPAFVGSVAPGAMADPLPQALALTAIVITFGTTTFLLALAYRSWVLRGHDQVQDDLEDHRIRSMAEDWGNEQEEPEETGTAAGRGTAPPRETS
ncbi:multisubunit sodium/proton antiporter, MrpC subunit [Amycolatopsis marina]|uniref:Multisubunit sodium/proton antiporter, MrpC subunit n=1 Tax=Amycolatopsis marina TaxID=490629 RepID=A0A1I0ZCV5_9PSEU|nr:Na(+)/H(+) antiporter subunit C [Amycolatopsis marina]SFB23351.1 multisubunit sodium/proton antiporter, MrpC subunit [Amycolatopsis marina]